MFLMYFWAVIGSYWIYDFPEKSTLNFYLE